ncbi:SasC/FmtB family protein [Alloscardovia omnicolens]|uniref:SasC/FmtB family protein n=1 Tax=Alloscardovia omnicolens TaxID=419015 RepID=UPI003A74E08E
MTKQAALRQNSKTLAANFVNGDFSVVPKEMEPITHTTPGNAGFRDDAVIAKDITEAEASATPGFGWHVTGTYIALAQNYSFTGQGGASSNPTGTTLLLGKANVKDGPSVDGYDGAYQIIDVHPNSEIILNFQNTATGSENGYAGVYLKVTDADTGALISDLGKGFSQGTKEHLINVPEGTSRLKFEFTPNLKATNPTYDNGQYFSRLVNATLKTPAIVQATDYEPATKYVIAGNGANFDIRLDNIGETDGRVTYKATLPTGLQGVRKSGYTVSATDISTALTVNGNNNYTLSFGVQSSANITETTTYAVNGVLSQYTNSTVIPAATNPERATTTNELDPGYVVVYAQPTTAERTVFTGTDVAAVDSITNLAKLPAGSTFAWKTKPDTSSPGAKTGVVTVTYPNGAGTKDINVTLNVVDFVNPDITIVQDKNNLTDDEKTAVKEEIKTKNPTLTDDNIVVNKDGSVTVTLPQTEGLPDTTKDLAQKDTVDELQDPVKTVVKDATSLTDDEKDAVTGKVNDIPNLPKGSTVTVGDDGTTTVKIPAKGDVPARNITIPQNKTVYTINDPVKTVVKDPTNLTDQDKDKIKTAVEKSNPDLPKDSEITVDKDGTVTITVPNQTPVTLTPDKTVLTINDPVKTVVKDPTNLTEDDKDKIKTAVEKSNPDLPKDSEITVDKDGTVTITVPNQTPVTLTPDKTVLTINDPVKTVVKDPTNLTEDDKDKIKTAVEKSNPDLPKDSEITVDKDGTVTITVPNQTPVTLTPDKTVLTINDPVKTVVKDPTNLTEDDKDKIKTAVEKSNPDLPKDSEITVDKDGTVTITVPNQTPVTLTPDKTVEGEANKPEEEVKTSDSENGSKGVKTPTKQGALAKTGAATSVISLLAGVLGLSAVALLAVVRFAKRKNDED